ncbi:hypothetical protein halTADL_0351 [Halohasta litchfieldiae]|jgi:hypothetical protein|uniref:DUF8106 domain-containing protein n=2 Tax=Halohasta litchfieldiae TaxID=1073996 RepID=A0A1H6TVZ2_9EURY|nr:hypothetical protein halTADL_0351 [Halohasta litchfieldiae]SEI84213.1 hypothetical protein SAMN05444271_10956 [Halohasta litchfieldiae]
MTVETLVSRMNGQPSTKQTPTRRKTVLFCRGCEYQGPPDGPWIIHRKPDSDVYLCPNCNTTVTVRDRFDNWE